VPSKCVIRSSRVLGEIRAAPELGVRVPEGSAADFTAVMERMRRLRARISPHDSAHRFAGELGVDVFLGEARFTGPDTVSAAGATLRFRKAVIATGGRPAHPDIPGLAEVGFLTSETVFSLTARPGHLAVVGGGPVGCELAQAFRRLGCEVTLLHRGAHLLPREDPDAAAVVEAAFRRDGVRLVLGAEIRKVSAEDGRKALAYDAPGGPGRAVVDELLVAAGRVPNVEGLGLEAAGVRHDPRAGVLVDPYLRTTNPRIYAAGDVCLRWRFTHAADAAARIVIQNALFGIAGRRKATDLVMPWCTYTDPEVARVGLSERGAAERGLALDTFVRHLREVDRGITDGATEGFVKVHVRKGTDRILGATIVAPHAGETISELTLAMVGKVGLGRLAGVVHPYPTQAEAVRQIADAYRRTRLTPLVRRLFAGWLAWSR
jgi:pyruvate/2-oxoglutarate dehydrogenase complex dihydrolipoamide dehydrogenase (E3) component